MSSMSSVIANLSSSVNSTDTSSDRLASDKFTFLKLLVAQLSNQDPLNPTDDQEFVAQLAQFTSLEQLQEINAGVGTLNDTMNQGQLMSATSFIGKAVVVSGSQVTKLNDAEGNIMTSYVYYTADSAFEKAYVTIIDASSNIIRQDTIDGRQAGTYPYEWNGKKDDGTEAASGVYQIIIAGVDKNDKSVLMSTEYEAQVTSVYVQDGVYYLGLSGGRSVPLTDVIEVGEVSTSTTTADNTTYADLAADATAKASLAADSATSYDKAIDIATTTSEDAKSAADKAISAAANARAAADEAAEVALKAREAAESAQTAASLNDYNDAKTWAEKAAEYADAAEIAAESARNKALAIDPDLEF